MLKPDEVFDGPVLDPESFVRVVKAFGYSTSWFYHGWGQDGSDQYPNLPIVVESEGAGHLIWILGLISGNRPGKCLLAGVAMVRGYKNLIHSGFEVLPCVPALMENEVRRATLLSIRKRMRFATVILARRANLIRHCEPSEPQDVLPTFSNTTSEPVQG